MLKAGQSIVMNITEFSLFQVSRMITDTRYGKSHILKEYYQRKFKVGDELLLFIYCYCYLPLNFQGMTY